MSCFCITYIHNAFAKFFSTALCVVVASHIIHDTHVYVMQQQHIMPQEKTLQRQYVMRQQHKMPFFRGIMYVVLLHHI
jgi:hypothetical protein